jgi:hypothetical protein
LYFFIFIFSFVKLNNKFYFQFFTFYSFFKDDNTVSFVAHCIHTSIIHSNLKIEKLKIYFYIANHIHIQNIMIKYILLFFATTTFFSKLSSAKENPIVLAAKIATALFQEFGTETEELNAKGNKKWKLPDIKDGIPFRTTLGQILKDNGGDVDAAINAAKKKYKSGELQKMVGVKQKNPIILAGKNATTLFHEFEYEEKQKKENPIVLAGKIATELFREFEYEEKQKKENPIVLAAKIATAIFQEFGTETEELNAKGNKKWKLPDIKDGIPFRTTLGQILKDNGCNVDAAINDAKKKYKSGELQKMVEAKQKK